MAEDGEERTMELTIEALTGTVYDLCVSPYETILGIKMKVQRLEGIPVYQQQLVWGGIELQDEYCLEEYSIPSGAQLKLLVAMRGGPIHAQRVHLDLEDPTLLEIAELLDSQCGDKYTLMLLRNGDDLDHASFVQVQMFEEDDTMRLSPIPVAAEPGQHMSLAANKATCTEQATCTEHAVTRDKMRELMSKFKKGKEFRQAPPPLPCQTPSGQLSRKGTGKVLILESRAPSRLLHSSASRVTPLSSAHTNDARLAQRKLVFPGDTCSHLHHSEKSRKRMASCSLSSRRVHSPSNETPIISRKTCSRVSEDLRGSSFTTSPPRGKGSVQDRLLAGASGLEPYTNLLPTPPKRVSKADLSCKNWHKPSKRKRRTSYIEPDLPVSTISDLSRNLSHLELSTPLPPIEQSPVSGGKTKTEFLPPILCPAPHHPRAPYPTPKALTQPLPSLNVTRKKRCMKCGKKMGLASTYSCRCGGLYCAIHRYAETHSCSFDYKTEGRQILARSNPVVAAQKLPKI